MNRLMIVACLMLSLTTQAQPPKRASKIIVAPSDTSVLLNRIALALIDKGFEIDRKDSELKTVTTKERSMQKGAAQTKIQAHINDTAVIFTSTLCVQLELNISGTIIKPTFDPVTYSGMKGSYMREAWNELEEIARKFGEKIIFSK